jgi:hypothetical protein
LGVRSGRVSRQVKRLTLAQLSREVPTEEELGDFWDLLALESDRGVAIMAGSLVENTLRTAVACRLADPGADMMKTWFEGPTAPFGSFAAKIKLGRAMGIYAEKMEQQLSLLKDIRNAFAHRSRPLDFRHPVILDACVKLSPRKGMPDDPNPARVRYEAVCMALAHLLVKDAFDNGGKELQIAYP